MSSIVQQLVAEAAGHWKVQWSEGELHKTELMRNVQLPCFD
jgi:hypothetical protein